jgi:hypothetical protein
MSEVQFPDKRAPTASKVEIGFNPQPPASAHPYERFDVSFWCYPYAKFHNSLSPRVTDLELAPLILGPRESFDFDFEWIQQKASNSDDSDVRPFPNLDYHYHLDSGIVGQFTECINGVYGVIEFWVSLNHVPCWGDYRIQVTIYKVETRELDRRSSLFARGESNMIRVK